MNLRPLGYERGFADGDAPSRTRADTQRGVRHARRVRGRPHSNAFVLSGPVDEVLTRGPDAVQSLRRTSDERTEQFGRRGFRVAVPADRAEGPQCPHPERNGNRLTVHPTLLSEAAWSGSRAASRSAGRVSTTRTLVPSSPFTSVTV